jgi:hypothetical protein
MRSGGEAEDAAARGHRRPARTHGWGRRRKPKTSAGLDAEHRAERARQMRLLAEAGELVCRKCGRAMYHPDRCPHGACPACTLHLGHATARALGGGRAGRALEHARCNIADGARLGQWLGSAASRPSRIW